MQFKCEKCNNRWGKTKINGLNANQLDPKDFRNECPKCKSKEISLVLNPKYKKKSIDFFSIKDMVKLEEPYKENRNDDPRGPIECDFRIYKTTRDSDGNSYFWLPYWITIGKKKKYGQFSPIIRECELTELIVKAIKSGFFKDASIKNIRDAVRGHEK